MTNPLHVNICVRVSVDTTVCVCGCTRKGQLVLSSSVTQPHHEQSRTGEASVQCTVTGGEAYQDCLSSEWTNRKSRLPHIINLTSRNVNVQMENSSYCSHSTLCVGVLKIHALGLRGQRQ